jgi:hypothetical protein
MKTARLRAPVLAPARIVARQRQWQRQLGRFDKRYRKTIAMLTDQNAAVADLAFSFPALLFALACPHKGLKRQALLQAVTAGVPLKALAALADVSFWLRKLPPEVFAEPIRKLPDDPAFVQQIGNCLPKKRQAARTWLRCAYVLTELGHGPFVAWGLRVLAPVKGGEWKQERAHLSALWAWYSLEGKGLAAELIARRWQPSMTLKKAVAATQDWHNALRLKLADRQAVITDFWFEPAIVDGFDIQPLTDAEQIQREARRMKNCLATYTSDVQQDGCRLWKVTRGGKTEAVLQVANYYGLQLLAVMELRGPENEDVSLELAKAVRRWQSMQADDRLLPPKGIRAVEPSQEVWRQLWKPYWLHKRKVPHWLPAKADWYMFDEMTYAPNLW